MKPEQQKNMLDVRILRDKIEHIIKPAFSSGQSVEIVKKQLLELLDKKVDVVVDTLNDDEQEPHAFI